MRKVLSNEELYNRAVLHLSKSLGLDFNKIVKRASERYKRNDPNDCSVISLCDYLAGELNDKEKRKVEFHLKRCGECRKLVRILERKDPRDEFNKKLLPRLVSKLLPKFSGRESGHVPFDLTSPELKECQFRESIKQRCEEAFKAMHAELPIKSNKQKHEEELKKVRAKFRVKSNKQKHVGESKKVHAAFLKKMEETSTISKKGDVQ